jgi:glycosyltransferase involved in cell wall biosynthesis
MPSFWEGFGLDPLYAMAVGVPVVVSNKGSLPEVVGDAGILVDPYTTESISAAIIKVLEMTQKEYNKLVSLGISQAKKFSWEKTARITLDTLKNVISR